MKNDNTTTAQAHNIIGNGTIIKGEIESNGDMRIDGRVNGSVKSNGKVVIGQNGVIEGTLICKQADISGCVKGNIKVEELTTMQSTARLEVELVTKQLFIEVGAIFTGHCNMGSATTVNNEVKK